MKHTHGGTISSVHGLEESILLKMSILFKATYKFKAIAVQTPVRFSTETGKVILKVIWSHKTSTQPKQSWAKRTKLEVSYHLTSKSTSSSYNKNDTNTKQSHSPMGQNRRICNKPTCLWLISLQQR